MTAIKTLSLRIRGAKVELEEAGLDADNMAQSVSSLQAKLLGLTGGRVDVMLDETTFKSTTEILRELAAAWEYMSDIDRASALELIGGKRQANIVAAIIENFDTVEEVIETSQNAMGSAERENEKYLDSIEGRIAQLSSSVQVFWNDLLDSEIIKSVVNILRYLVEVLDSVAGRIGMITGAIGAVANRVVKQLPQIKTQVTEFVNSIKYGAQMSKALTSASGVSGEAFAGAVGSALGNRSDGQKETIVNTLGLAGATQTLNAAQAENALQTMWAKRQQTGLTEAEMREIAARVGYNAAIKDGTLSLQAFTQAQRASRLAMLASGISVAVAAISILAAVFARFAQEQKKANEELKESADHLADVQEELDDLNDKLTTTRDRMAELNAMDTLSFTDKEELANLEKQNAELERQIELQNILKKEALKDDAQKFEKAVKNDSRFGAYQSTVDLTTGEVVAFGSEHRYKRFGPEAPEGRAKETTYTQREYADFLSNIIQTSANKAEVEYAAEELGDLVKKMQEIKNNAGQLTYGVTDEADKLLDDLAYIENKYMLLNGGASTVIDSVLRNDQFTKEYKAIQKIASGVNAFNVASSTQEIKALIEANDDLAASYEALGISIDDVAARYADITTNNTYKNVEIAAQKIAEARGKINGNLLREARFSAYTEDGTIDRNWLAQKFNGASSTTLKSIEKIFNDNVDAIRAGTYNAATFIDEFASKAKKEIIDLNTEILSTETTEAFPNIKDSLTGIIDTFAELKAAVDDTKTAMDLLENARGESMFGGSISVDTLAALSEYTDKYEELLEVTEDGRVILRENADELMFNERKRVLMADAQAKLDAALYAQEAYNSGRDDHYASQEKVDNAVAQAKALVASIDALEYGTDKAESRLDAINKRFEDRLDLLSKKKDEIQGEIDVAEKRGEIASTKSYLKLAAANDNEKNTLIAKKKALEEYYEANKKTLTDEQIKAYRDELKETNDAIVDATKNAIEYAKAIEAINQAYRDQKEASVSDVTNDIEMALELLDYEFGDASSLEYGDMQKKQNAAGLLNVEGMEAAAFEARRYAEELDNAKASYAAYQQLVKERGGADNVTAGELADIADRYGWVITSEEDLAETTRDLTSKQRDSIKNYENYKQAIVSLVEEGLNRETEAYRKYVEALKESLSAERNLYDFKKNVEKQERDIAETERKIAALTGSTAQADIAERRKLEAQLYDQRQSLDDTYRDNERSAQDEALDHELSKYEEAQQKRIELLKQGGEESKQIFKDVIAEILKAGETSLGVITDIAEKYDIKLSDILTNPLEDTELEYEKLEAKAEAYADYLTSEEFKSDMSMTTVAEQLQSVVDKWDAIKEAAEAATKATHDYTTETEENEAVEHQLTQGRIKQIKVLQKFEDKKPAEQTTNSVPMPGGPTYSADFVGPVEDSIPAFLRSVGFKSIEDLQRYLLLSGEMGVAVNGKFDGATISALQRRGYKNIPMYATGTMGTKASGLAITDESWIGEELTLAAGKSGRLQYLSKGSSVLPANLAENLVEWGKINPNALMQNHAGNVVVTNAINKPELTLNVEKFLSIDRVDEGTLPEVKKFVQQQMDNFVKKMNYSLKAVGAR